MVRRVANDFEALRMSQAMLDNLVDPWAVVFDPTYSGTFNSGYAKNGAWYVFGRFEDEYGNSPEPTYDRVDRAFERAVGR